MLTAERLRELLDYDPEAGIFVWLSPALRARRANVGGRAGGSAPYGYLRVGIDGGVYLAHRLVWLYVHGIWPERDIDHLNGIRTDNRISNLRHVSRSINLQNRRSARSDSLSGLLGVEWHGASGLWHARIRAGGVRHCLGYFRDKHEAHQAYLEAKRRLHEGCTI
jgi:hypothetical protein